MKIKNKLLLSFLTLSTLIMIVGLIFYSQLKGLIEPLTPQSIPHSIEQLETAINKTNLIYKILYQQQLVEYNLTDYVYSNQLSSLQDYYMNHALLWQTLQDARKKMDPTLTKNLNKQFTTLNQQWTSVLQNMQNKNPTAAKQIITSSLYLTNIQNIRNTLNRYYQQFDATTNETSVVTVKVATKNTTHILLDSLSKTLVIFLDAIVISFLLAYLWSRNIANPIKTLRNDMENLSSSDLDTTIDAKLSTRHGEIGDLTRSFVGLIKKLRTTTVSRDKLLVEIERRKKSEENLRQTAEQLAESNRELDQFAYSASHDLRAPLQGIETLTEWIHNDCYDILPEKSRKHLNLLKRRVHRLDALIHGILEYSRVKAINENDVAVNVKELLKDVIDNLALPKHIKIDIENNLPNFMTDKSALTQVFHNLINNAIKFIDKPEGEIKIGSERNDQYFQFYIADNGPGIEPQFHKKIFEIFQTLQSRDTLESTGIGLALVKKIVEKQGGKIWLTSVPGQGTTFYFTWPKVRKA